MAPVGEADGGVSPTPAAEAVAVPEEAAADAGVPRTDAPTKLDMETKKLTKKLPKGFVGVHGRVVDAKNGEGLIEATVKVVAGGKKSALTDVDGFYRLKLPPGTYDLRVFYELYEGRRIQNVEVKEGQALELNVELQPDSRSVTEVIVEAKADKRNESALLAERRKATVVQDAIGAQEIARTPDSSAGDSAKRVVAVTLLDDRYVYIRGLGGRYASTLLNNTILPSPEPDEPSVPLDLFPVALLANLSVVKTYSAELPGTFGGGSISIETNTFPATFEARVRLQVTGDTLTTFQRRLGNDISFLENFGLRNEARDLPASMPRDQALEAFRPAFDPEPARGTPDDIRRQAALDLSRTWLPKQVTSLPNFTLGANIGDTVPLGKEARLGYLVAVQFGRRERRKPVTFGEVTGSTGMDGTVVFEPVSPGSAETGSISGATSVLGNFGLQFNRNNEISLLSLTLVNAEDQAFSSVGNDFQQAIDVFGQRLQFTQRQLFFNQLKGFHRLEFLNDLEVTWQANYSRVNRLEPDIRDTRYQRVDNEAWRLRLQPNSGERFFVDLGEDSGGGSLGLNLPVRNWNFRLGGLAQHQERFFNGRRFRFVAEKSSGGRLPEELETLNAEQVFTEQNIGPSSGNWVVGLLESTFVADQYRASFTVFAAYALVDWKATDWFKASAGFRFENSTQSLTAKSPFVIGGREEAFTYVYQDPMPSVNLTFTPLAQVNIRAAYSFTVARPTFREIGPFIFYDVIRRRNVAGNPELQRTQIHHADLRAEWFPTDSEVFAVSVFGKQFINPIERVVIGMASQEDFGFRNALTATLGGVEVEFRTNLGRLAPSLQNVRLGANASLIYSTITLPADSLSRSDRPLQGQSPYVANAYITWSQPEWGTEVGLFYNVYGPRITEVSTRLRPDFVEQPFHRLDATISQNLGAGFQIKLTAANLLNQAVRLNQGDVEVLRYAPAVQFGASLAWQYTRERK